MPYATDVVEAIHAVVSASSFPGSPDYYLRYVPKMDDEGQASRGTEIYTFLQSFADFERQNKCSDFLKTYTVGVAIRKYLSPTAGGQVDDTAVTTLLDAIEDLIDTVVTAGAMANCRFIDVSVDQPFDFEKLHDTGIFQTLISFEYKG